LVIRGIKADRKRKLKLEISNAKITDYDIGLLLDADTYVENFLRLKISLPRWCHFIAEFDKAKNALKTIIAVVTTC